MGQQPLPNSTPDPFKRLPSEVLRLIVGQFCAHCCGEYEQPFKVESSVQDTTTLYNLCLASRHFRDPSQEILFHCFGVEAISSLSWTDGWKWRLEPFLRTIASRHDLARSVKIVNLHWLLLCQLSFDGSKDIFDKCAISLGTSAFSIFLHSRTGKSSETSTIRESFLLRGPIPSGIQPGQYLPIVASELLAIILAVLPQIFYLGVMQDPRFVKDPNIERGRGWQLDVSLHTLDALGLHSLGLKTLESDYGIPKLISRAKNLETFITGGYVEGHAPELPNLKSLHIIHGWTARLRPATGYLPLCTGHLTSLSFTAAEPDISTLLEYLDQPRFHDSLESLHLDFRVSPNTTMQPMPSLKLFTKLRTLFLPARPIYITAFAPRSLVDILPPTIESLAVVDDSLPRSHYHLYVDMVRLQQNKTKLFPNLRWVISDSHRLDDPVLSGLFWAAGIALICRNLLKQPRRYTGHPDDRDRDPQPVREIGWLEQHLLNIGIDPSPQVLPLPGDLSDDDL